LINRDEFNMFFYSLKKDIKKSMFPLLRVLLVVVIITFIFLVSLVNSAMFSSDTSMDDYSPGPYSSNYDFLGVDEYRADISDSNGPSRYTDDEYSNYGGGATGEALAAFLFVFLPMLVILCILHAMAVTRERSSGTIRSYFHYPYSYRRIMVSKTINVCVMTFLVSVPMVLMAMVIFILAGESSSMVLGMAVLSYLFVVGQYLFFVSLSAVLHKVKVKNFLSDPLGPMIIGNVIFIILTETFILAAHNLMSDIFMTSDKTPGIIFIRFITPAHAFGELIDLIFLGQGVSIVDFLWAPLFLAVVIFAPFLMKNIYPDIFIKETA
jgi:hypothetical protein